MAIDFPDTWGVTQHKGKKYGYEVGRIKEIVITIDTTNDAFMPEPHNEIARILKQIAHNITTHRSLPSSVRDINGNTAATIEVK